MKNRTTTQKLLILIFCFFAGLMVITWVGNQGMLTNTISVQELTNSITPATMSLSNINTGVALLQRTTVELAMCENDYSARDEFVTISDDRKEIWEQIDTDWESYLSFPKEAQEQGLADGLVAYWQEFKGIDNSIGQIITDLAQNNDQNRQILLYQQFYENYDEIRPMYANIKTRNDELIELISQINLDIGDQVVNKVSSTGNVMTYTSFGISTLLVLFSYFIWRSINNPLSELNRSIDNISSGRLDVATPCQELKNELGQVGRNVEKLRQVSIEKEKLQVELQKAGDYLRDKNLFLEKEVKARTEEAIAMHRLTRYFSPKIAERLIADDEINRVRIRNLTIFMADIRGFTRISDEVIPEDLFAMLNEYFDEMTQIVFSFEGTVGKCFGDTVMGFFGDPEDCPNQAELAVRMALQMQDKARSINENSLLWKEHRLNIGIGINTGYVTVGNVGSETHKDYVVIGRNVNLAARLTEKAKPGQILVSSNTYNLIADLFKTDDVGNISAKGFENPIQAYNILDSL